MFGQINDLISSYLISCGFSQMGLAHPYNKKVEFANSESILCVNPKVSTISGDPVRVNWGN